MQELRSSIYQFLSDEFAVDAGAMADNTPLISAGVIDSLGVIDYVEFLSKLAHVTIENSEISLKNLDTVGRALEFVASKMAA